MLASERPRRALVFSSCLGFAAAVAVASAQGSCAAEPPAAPQPAATAVVAATYRTVERRSHVRNWLLTGFVSRHFGNLPENNVNSGVFFEHDFDSTWGAYIGQYKNSGYIQSKIVAADFEPLHAGGFSFGLLAGFVTGYRQLGNGHLSPAGLPIVSYETRAFKLAGLCVPPVIKSAEAECSIQFGLNLGDAPLGL